MKTKGLLLMLCMICSISCSTARDQVIKGNGQSVTKSIQISDYSEIVLMGSADFTYEQSEKAPALELTIDENLLNYVEVRVDGKKLIVRPKQENRRTYSISPTVFQVRSNSKELQGVSVGGSGSWNCPGDLRFKQLKLSIVGSGTSQILGKAEGEKIDCSIAGSGDVHLEQLQTQQVKGEIAGSGNIQLKGSVEEASLHIAGSGNVKASECSVKQARCDIAGSGSIHIHASESLIASIAGSGDIYYQGNPQVSVSVAGSGKVQKK